ncbi:hypothetical protein MKX01_032780 [Papaver californicum]|nr:hypothetical protein MKX01_032780 [Papaver californicum]
MMTTDNVIDVLQLATWCDAPRLPLMCVRMVVKDFKTISATEGWKVMKSVDTALGQELLEAVVEAESLSLIEYFLKAYPSEAIRQELSVKLDPIGSAITDAVLSQKVKR